MQSLIHFDEQLSAQFSQFTASSFLAQPFIWIGVGFVYLVPLILIYTWFKIDRKVALKAAIAGVIAWEGLSKLIAHLVDRARPSMSQIGTKELVFHRPDTSFPSDHSAFLMAVACTFYLSGQKKLGHLALILAILIGIARVGIGVHFPADILAGWVVGGLTAYIIHLLDKPLDQYVLSPLIKLAAKCKL